jgi:hypothetical protein
MGTSRAALCFGALLALGGAAEVHAMKPAPDGMSIGRYRIEPSGTALSISRPRDRSLALAALAGGLVVVGFGVGLRGTGRSGAGTGVLLLGLGLAGIGAVAWWASELWRVDEVELVRESFGGRVTRWPQTAIADVAIIRRARSVEDLKRTRIRPWDVTIRGPDGARLPVRFPVDSESDARALATILAQALAVPVREP